MEKINELLTFLYERREDKRVSFQKENRPDAKNYYVYFEPDNDPATKTSNYNYKGRMMIFIDNENKCISLSYGSENEVIIENCDLIKLWSDKIEEYIQEIADDDFDKIVNESFNDAFSKDFLRDWKMKKIFDGEDEPI